MTEAERLRYYQAIKPSQWQPVLQDLMGEAIKLDDPSVRCGYQAAILHITEAILTKVTKEMESD